MAEMLSDDGSLEVPLDAAPQGFDERGERMMTMEELKQEMFKSLKDTGTIEAIRAQLRRRFIEKLKMHGRNIKRASEDGGNNIDDDDRGKPAWSVDEQLVHGLVLEYLQHHNMEHTMAVFVPEIGGVQQLLSRDAIVQMLRVEDAHLSSSVGGNNDAKPLVTVLLKELTRRLTVATMSSATQTAMDCHDHRLALENQLRRVENTYLAECASHKADYSAKSFEERVLRYQREYDEMCEKRLKEDLERFRITELGLMRVEERRKFEREMDATKTTMLQEHRERLQRLQDRERELEMEFAARKAELESSLFEARQRVFQDIEKLRVKQQDVEARYNSETRHITMETKRLQLLEEAVQAREENMQSTVDSMLREKEKMWQLEKLKWESEIKAREQQLLVREHELEEGIRRMSDEKVSIQETKKRIAALESELISAQDALALIESKLCKAEAEKKALSREIDAREQLLGEDKHNMKTLSYENARLSAELKGIHAERSKLEDVVVEKTSETRQLENELKDLQHQMIQLKLSEATGIVEERKRLMQILESERAESRWRENEMVGRLRELQSRLGESEAAAEKNQTQYEDEKVHVEALRHEVASLHTLLAQAQSAVSSRQAVGVRSASHARSLNGGDLPSDMNERMMMKMMEMMSQIAAMQSFVGSSRDVSSVFQPQNNQSGDGSHGTMALRRPDDEEKAKLRRDQERLEREILDQREAERKRKEREENEERDMEERRQKFQEELKLERQQRVKYEEEMEAEQRRRLAEQKTELQAELERQQKALDDAREAQKRLIDEQIAAEQQRLQKERYIEEERTRLAKEKADSEHLLQVREEQKERERQQAVDTDESSLRVHLTHGTIASVNTDNVGSVQASSPELSQIDDHNIPSLSLKINQDEVRRADAAIPTIDDCQPTSVDSQEREEVDHESISNNFHSEAVDSDNEVPGDSSSAIVVENKADHADIDETRTATEEKLSPTQTAETSEVTTVEKREEEQLDQPILVITKTEEELGQERREEEEAKKKKQDEDALDVYRQRVLARRAAEKQRQQELEDQRKREEEERIAAEQARLRHSASDDEMENSGGSFASSAASSSGSF